MKKFIVITTTAEGGFISPVMCKCDIAEFPHIATFESRESAQGIIDLCDNVQTIRTLTVAELEFELPTATIPH